MGKRRAIGLETSQIVQGDALALLDQIADNSVNLVLSSPPYNIGKPYERGMFGSLDDYQRWMEKLIAKLVNKLEPSGSICWQVGNHVADGVLTPLDYIFFPMFAKHGWHLRNRIIWRFNFGLHAQRRFSGRYETLLWFTKSADYKFNLDPVRVPQLYPGKRHSAKKGDRAGLPSGNPLGKNPSDYWEFDAAAAFDGEPVWNFPNVKANHPEKTGHPCQFPNELADRCILAMTSEGDVVLDPFAGTGTTVICAEGRDRIGVGFELDLDHAISAGQRLERFREGNLPIRPSGIQPRQPVLGERVATIPDEWLLETAE
jgi:adenine-specific DNA-methyltransferase